MDRVSIKQKARGLMQTTTPLPVLVGAVYCVLGWIVTYLNSRVGGTGVNVDVNSLYQAGADISQAIQVKYPTTAGGSAIAAALGMVMMIVGVGFSSYALRVSRQQSAGYANLLDGFSFFLRVIGLNLLEGLIIFAGTLCFIVPGIILSFSYSQAIFLMLDHPDWGVTRCLRESRMMMRGNKWDYFVFRLSFIGWILACILPVMEIFVNPYIEISCAEYYNRLIGYQAQTEPGDTWNPGEKPPWEY